MHKGALRVSVTKEKCYEKVENACDLRNYPRGGVLTALAESVSVTEGSQTLTQSADTTARYLRVKCLSTNPWETQHAGVLWGFSFFGVTKDGDLVAYPSGTTAKGSDGSDAAALLSTERGSSSDYNWQSGKDTSLIIDMGENVTFNGYSWGQVWNAPGRAPYDFTIEISLDGEEWFMWEERRGAMSAAWGVSDGTGSYCPRTDAQPVANAIPIFDAADTVTISAEATLVLDHVNGRVPNLSGAGTLRVEGGHIILTGNCTFTGSIEGWGYVDFATENDVLHVAFGSSAFVVRNLEKAHTWRVTGILPETLDSAAAPLSLVLSGAVQRMPVPKTVTTTYGEEVAPTALHGTTTFENATVTVLSGAPRIARFLRYMTITPEGGTDVHMVGEVELRLAGERQAIPDASYYWQNWYATTNFTLHAISSQNAWEGRYHGTLTNLTDGDPDTYYQKQGINGTAKEPYAQIDMRYPIAFDTASLSVSSQEKLANGAYLPQQWIIETSADGWNWTRVQTQDTNYAYKGAWPYERGELTDTAVAESSVWVKGAVAVAEGTCAVDNALKYLRMLIYGLSGNGGENVGKFTSFGEMQLYKDSVWQSWATGTTAEWIPSTTSTSATNICNSTAEFKGGYWSCYQDNQANDQGGEAQYSVASAEVVANGIGFIIKSPSDLSFDSYALYMGAQWEANNRVPNKWQIDVSYDGSSWATIDSCDNGYEIFTAIVGNERYMWDHRFCVRSVDNSTLVTINETDDFSDDETLTIAAGATLKVHSARETIGRLEGAGTVAFSGHSPALIVKGAEFSGKVTGSGELIFASGTNHLDGADLAGVSKITLREGAVVTGSASFGGNDLTVVSEGGAWAAECSNIGTFTLTGSPLVMPRLVAAGDSRVVRKCFEYTATDEDSKELFRASTAAEYPEKYSISLTATDQAMTFKAAAPGLAIIVR